MSITDEIRRLRVGAGDPRTLLEAFRATTVYLERMDPLTIPLTMLDGLNWIKAFTSPDYLPEGTDYLAVTGERLLDTYLPALPRNTGVVLDAGTDTMLTLPPVKGIVAEELAVDA